jgi:hypothetical protein
MADDLLTTIRAEIGARLSELRPLLAEYEELLSVTDALATEGRAVPNAVPKSPPRAVASRRAHARRGSAAGAIARAASSAGSDEEAPTKSAGPTRKRTLPTGQAIVAALEHGSHTVAELVVVTALPASDIRDGLRRLRKQQAIVKTDRAGKAAYVLPAAAAAET